MNKFKEEIESFNNEFIYRFLKRYFETVPEEFYIEAASSTGKYHPEYAQGEEGLYRHTKAAFLIANDLLQLEMFEKYFIDDLTPEIILAAVLVHDTCKRGEKFTEKYTKFEHPLLASEKIETTSKELLDEIFDTKTQDKLYSDRDYYERIITRIRNAVESHMGQWNTSNYYNGILPKPEGFECEFVHLCDYLASRKYLEVPMDYLED